MPYKLELYQIPLPFDAPEFCAYVKVVALGTDATLYTPLTKLVVEPVTLTYIPTFNPCAEPVVTVAISEDDITLVIDPSVALVSCTNAVTEQPAVPVLAASNSIKIEFTPLEPLFAV